MGNRYFSWPFAVVGTMVLLGGCVGQPRTFPIAKPIAGKTIVLEPRAAVRAPTRPVTAAQALSPAQKERLFREFQSSQSRKTQAVTAVGEPTP